MAMALLLGLAVVAVALLAGRSDPSERTQSLHIGPYVVPFYSVRLESYNPKVIPKRNYSGAYG